jgi:hypothetical protein
MPFPPKKLTNVTDDILRQLPATKYGTGYLTDEQVPLLTCWRHDYDPENVHFVCVYPKHKLVVNGRARGREIIGRWPEMSIEKARAIAVERGKMWEEQKNNPVSAPLYRKYKGRHDKRRPVTIDEMLAPSVVMTPEEEDRYQSLMLVLMDAHTRAAEGKGKDRHDNGQKFEDQSMAAIMDNVGDDFALGQAMKKLVESRNLPWEKARNERLDAMVYIAGSILWKDRGGKA